MMSDIADNFKNALAAHFDFLLAKGFKKLVEENPTSISATYVGTNVCFGISYDVRDDDITLTVAKVKNGKCWPTIEGGYSSDFFKFLVDRKGYRGGVIPKKDVLRSNIDRYMEAWAKLLRDYGDSLLDDDISGVF